MPSISPSYLWTGFGVHRVLCRQSTGNLGDEKRWTEISQVGLLVFQGEGQQPFRYLDRCWFCVAGFIIDDFPHFENYDELCQLN